jgi:urease accessory protein
MAATTLLTTMPTANLHRLLQLVSPTLPVGAFTYSQGLEWAVERGWVDGEATLEAWTEALLCQPMARLEVPLLGRLHQAAAADDRQALAGWTRELLASRETRELRQEERQRGRALAALLQDLGLLDASLATIARDSQLTGFAVAAVRWEIPLPAAAQGHLWSWLEGSVLAGVKLIPLGQTAGQRILARLSPRLPALVQTGLALDDDAIGAGCPAQLIASSRHETQYTRLFRS